MPDPSDIPTEAQVYDMYEELLDAINHELLNSNDDDVHDIFEPLSQDLTDLLDDDDMVALDANTAKFAALTAPMKTVNDSLKAAETDIASVSDKLADSGKILSGLTTILTTAAKFA